VGGGDGKLFPESMERRWVGGGKLFPEIKGGGVVVVANCFLRIKGRR